MSWQLAASASATVDESGKLMDESAFRAFYEQTSRPLLRYLIHVTRRQDIAEDLSQEAYCRFLTANLPDMDTRRARSYLFRIATNLMYDRWRQMKENSPPDDTNEAISSAPALERRLGLRQAFSRLKMRERQLLYLAYVEGESHKEIADSTGLRVASIRLLLFRARRKLVGLIGGASHHGATGVHK